MMTTDPFEKQIPTHMKLGQTDLDGWMNDKCSIAGTHKVRAPWWIKEEMKKNV